MLTPIGFVNRRRQIYLDEESYDNTIAQLEAETGGALIPGLSQEDLCRNLRAKAFDSWAIFKRKYTEDNEYSAPFALNDMIDTYVDYLNLLSAAVLLRREDLIPRIHAFNEGTDFDESDAVLEELLKFFLPNRPELDEWLWNKPYRKLLDAIDSGTPEEMSGEMKLYVKNWYKDMKGVAHFWGKHEQINPEYTPYYGYWAMCAAAFTYLYNIDDSSYRNETVYPKDLVDYARSIPRSDDTQQNMSKPLRVAGGEPCPKSGQWFSPAKADNPRHFSAGQSMPELPDAPYGLTIWQWMGD